MRKIATSEIKQPPLDHPPSSITVSYENFLVQVRLQARRDARKELHPMPVPPPSPEEAQMVHALCFTALAHGHLLHPCEFPHEAQRLCAILNHELPPDYDAFVVRQREVNVYRGTIQ